MGNSFEMDQLRIDHTRVASDNSCKPTFTGNTTEEHLIFLRDAFKSEIPDFVVHSNYRDSNYKVRGNWWQGLLFSLETMIDESKVSDDHLKDVNDLVEHCLEHGRFHKTTEEEIAWANGVINMVVSGYELEHPELMENPPYEIPNQDLCL